MRLLNRKSELKAQELAAGKVLFNLDSQETIEALYSKYEHFLDFTDLVTKVSEVFTYLGSLLNNKETRTVNRMTYLPTMIGNQANPSEVAMSVKALLNKGLRRNFEVHGTDYVRLQADLPSLFTRYSGFSDRSDAEKQAAKAMLAGLDALLPGFKFPETWEKQEDERILGTIPKVQKLWSILDLASLRPRVSPLEKISPPDMTGFKPYKGVVHIVLFFKEAKPAGFTTNTRGKVDLANDNFNLEIGARLELHFPMEFAMWSVMSETMDRFIPYQFWSLINDRMKFYSLAKKSRGTHPPAEQTFCAYDVSVHRDEYMRDHGVKPIKKSNEDGFSINMYGQILWIPEINDPKGYAKDMVRAFDPNKKEFLPKEGLSFMNNKPIFVDWVTDKLYFTNASGDPSAMDLLGSRVLDPVTIAVKLNKPCGHMLERMIGIIKRSDFPYSSTFRDHTLLPGVKNLLWVHLCGERYGDEEDTSLDRINQAADRVGNDIRSFYKDIDKHLVGYSLYDQIQTRFWFHLVAVYGFGANRNTYDRALADALDTNIGGVKQSPPVVYNLPGIPSGALLPNQYKVKSLLDVDPKNATISTNAGGGKSLQTMDNISAMLARKKITKALVIMPDSLIRNWCKDLSAYSKGLLRPFPITLEVWKRWTETLKLNWTQIRQLIENQPPNTVFVTSYNFLKHGVEQVGFDRFEFDFYPKANFIANLGFDYVALDESHRLRNLYSNQTQATISATSHIDYKRLLSGTFIFKSIEDKIGQMAIINPAALGTSLDDYADEVTGSFDMSRLPELNRNISTYARQISSPRREWAFLLPKIYEELYFVDLTRAQNAFYSKIMAEALEDVENDPKLMKLIKSGDPEAEAAIEAKMSRYFAKVEMFVNAPDSTVTSRQYGNIFKNLSSTKDEDLVSPKVKMTDRLIDFHIKGGKHPINTKDKKSYAPDPNKVIVFGVNLSVSEHLMRHSRYSNVAVRYTAGDLEALDEFINNPKKKVLFADSTSMTEGHNLQVASRCIVLQTQFTPGFIEQFLARILRPDVPDASGKTKYNRQSINVDIIVTQNTLEVAKQARILSRIVHRGMVEEMENSPSFKAMVKSNPEKFDLPLLSMGLETLKKYSNSSALVPYYESYSLYKKWEDEEFDKARETLRKQVSQSLGREVSMKDLPSLAMVKVTSKTLPNSPTGGYTPWIKGYQPFDEHNMNLQPLSEAGEPDDEGEGEDIENQALQVSPGDNVLTEFGPAVIEKMRRGSSTVDVQVPGLSDSSIKLNRSSVLVPTNPSKKKALDLLVKQAGSRGMPSMQMVRGVIKVNTHHIPTDQFKTAEVNAKKLKSPSKAVKEEIKPSRQEKDVKKPSVKEKSLTTYQFGIGAINHNMVLYTYAGGKKDDVFRAQGFHEYGESYTCSVDNYKGMQNMLDLLRSTFVVPSDLQRNIEKVIALLRQNKDRLEKILPKNVPFLRKYYLDNTRKPKEKMELHPYVMIEDGELFIYVNKTSNPASRKLPTLKKVAFCSRWQLTDPIMFKFLNTKQQVLHEMQALEKRGIVPENQRAFEKELKALH